VNDIPEAKWAFSGKEDFGMGDIVYDEEIVLQKLEKLREQGSGC